MINLEKTQKIENAMLCKLNKQPILEIPINCIQSLERGIDKTPIIELKVNKYIIQQDNKKKIENPLYYELKNKRYILINNNEYFIIDEIKESKISEYKEIIAYGGEQILTRRQINIEDIGIQILDDDPNNDVYSLNTLLKEVGWSIGDVDIGVLYDFSALGLYTEDGLELFTEDNIPLSSEGILKMRWQESIDNNWLDFLKVEIAEQFNCLPVFDTINRKINLINLDTLGEEIKICLCRDNYIKSKEKVNNSDDLITVLKLKGNEELDIGAYVPTGYDFITNFSYFITTGEMSNELIQALNKYDKMVEIRHPQWKALVEEKTLKEKNLDIKRNQWQMSISTIEMHKRLIERYRLENMVAEENLEKVALAEEIDKELLLRHEVNELMSEIELLEQSIYNINILCKYETATDENGNLIFNESLLNELLEFIFVDIYKDDSYIDAEAMLESGRRKLEDKCKPTISISIDSVNFMNRLVDNNFRLTWNGELAFGDVISLIDEDDSHEEFYYFIGFKIDYNNNSLTLELSNKKANRDNARTINQWLKESKNSKKLLITNRYLFNNIKKNRLNMDNRKIQ